MLNKKDKRLIKPILYLYDIAVSFLGSCISPLYLVSQGLQEINSFIVAFDLLCFKRVTIIDHFSETFSASHFIVAAITEKKRQQRPTKIRKKVTADTNRGTL